MITLHANAKINLYLEIVGSRPDGFHELVMVMQSVALFDRVVLKPLNAPTIQVLCDHSQVPTDHTNLAYRAVTLLQKRFPHRTNRHGGVEISIDKKIPVGAGLAGGSANAAAVLFGLDILWQLGLTRMELQALGAELGSDIPFCLAGGCAIATGRGEDVDVLGSSPKLHVILAKYTSISVSTPWAYQAYRKEFQHTYLPLNDAASLQERRSRVHSGPMLKAISAQDSAAIGHHLHNDLEKVVLPAHPKVTQLKALMTKATAEVGGLGTLMSGSGPTVFSLTESVEQAQAIAQTIRTQTNDPDLQINVAPFTDHGIETQP